MKGRQRVKLPGPEEEESRGATLPGGTGPAGWLGKWE